MSWEEKYPRCNPKEYGFIIFGGHYSLAMCQKILKADKIPEEDINHLVKAKPTNIRFGFAYDDTGHLTRSWMAFDDEPKTRKGVIKGTKVLFDEEYTEYKNKVFEEERQRKKREERERKRREEGLDLI